MSSNLFASAAKPAPMDIPAEARKPQVLQPAQFDTCAGCIYAEMIPQDVNALACHGAPPVPVVMGLRQTPAGPQPHIEAMRPIVMRNTRACAMWKRKRSTIIPG